MSSRSVIDEPVLDEPAVRVHPNEFTRLGINGADINAFEGPDAGCEIHCSVGHYRAAARRPARDQTLISQ